MRRSWRVGTLSAFTTRASSDWRRYGEVGLLSQIDDGEARRVTAEAGRLTSKEV